MSEQTDDLPYNRSDAALLPPSPALPIHPKRLFCKEGLKDTVGSKNQAGTFLSEASLNLAHDGAFDHPMTDFNSFNMKDSVLIN